MSRRGAGRRCAAIAMVVLAWPVAARAAARPVTLAAMDGTTIAGDIYEAVERPAPAVVLVHMLSRSKSDWTGLATELEGAGITALAIDLRGHGGSGGSAASLQDMVQDVRAAVQWLAGRPGVRPGGVGIVGASLGANLALLAAADEPLARAVAALSPAQDYRGLRLDSAIMKRIGVRAVWLAASTADPLALRTQKELSSDISGPREQQLSDSVAHGTNLVLADQGLRRALVDWLRRTLLS